MKIKVTIFIKNKNIYIKFSNNNLIFILFNKITTQIK